MVKHNWLQWRPVICKSTHGDFVYVSLPKAIETRYRGTLASRIFSMCPKVAISFETAINLIAQKQKEAFSAGKMGRQSGQYQWYMDNFVEYISEIGFHIELTGDEFESSVISDKIF